MDDMERDNKKLFVIDGGASDDDKRMTNGNRKNRANLRISAPRQLSKTVNLVNQKAIQWLQARAEEVLAQVDDSLFSMAEKSHQQEEQDRLFLAIRAIRGAHSKLLSDFCDGVEERFHAPRNDIPGEDFERDPSSALPPLSLLNDDDLEQQVAIRTMVSNVQRDQAESVASLSLRLDTLLPGKIYGENMPLGPAAICAAFADALDDVDISLRARMTVFKKFELQLVNRLGELYKICNNLLIEQGVLPAIEDPLHRRSRQGRVPGSPGAVDARTPEQSAAVREGALVAGGGATGHGNFIAGLMPLGSGAAPMATPTLLQHLGQFQMSLPVQSGATGELVNVTELIQQSLVASKQSASLHELDSEVIRLVDMLFSFMLEDRNLAEPIKAQLIRLQLPMLKLAVADKAFFSKSGHPARRLLNELADAAIGWQPGEKYLDDPLYHEICAIVDGVLSEYGEDEQVFARLLESFREFSVRERKRAAVMERRTIDEARGSARVEAAKARVAAVFDALTAERKLPKIVHEWLDRVWGSVLFRTCLRDGTDSGSWRQHVLTARDLIWSVAAPMPESSAKMRQLLPDLKKRLEEGAQSLSLSGGDLQRLLGGLEVLYRERQKLGERVESERERRIRERLVQELRREADSVLAIPVADGVTSAATQEFDVLTVRLDDTRELPSTQKALPAVEEIQQVVTKASVTRSGGLTALPENDDYWLQTYHLKDSWFLLRQLEKLPIRCRLAAIISDLDQFMFVNRQGAKVGVYSRLELAHALRDEELLPLEQGPLFERALQHVVGNCGESRLAISV
ncbi:DUF1631 family protein [Microbulbifer sp. SH-1]|uniref:DUF1631 family protein n=1 Tax=Microbulbifer sp. SH-1 TaxID=2681547 RepID=UPI001409AF16|nr:DUF1631 family protein [Microbulbifer sp. SH-1]QIL88786.1 DUF1631 family protein [Microbulbifer sp. SH-1]